MAMIWASKCSRATEDVYPDEDCAQSCGQLWCKKSDVHSSSEGKERGKIGRYNNCICKGSSTQWESEEREACVCRGCTSCDGTDWQARSANWDQSLWTGPTLAEAEESCQDPFLRKAYYLIMDPLP